MNKIKMDRLVMLVAASTLIATPALAAQEPTA